jgi:hypothetical protein
MRLASSPKLRSRYMMVAVPDAPMAADGRRTGLCLKRDLAGIVSDLAPWPPQASAGVPAQGAAGDAHDAGDEGLPTGIEPLGGEDLDAAMLLAPVGMAVDGGEVIGRSLDGAQAGQALKQARLVVLHPHQQRVAGRRRGGEAFFGSAGRRR